MKIELTEHINCEIINGVEEDSNSKFYMIEDVFSSINLEKRKPFKVERKKDIFPFKITKKDDSTYVLNADYYIGLDWLVVDEKYINVVPKINAKLLENYIRSLDLEEEIDAEKEAEIDVEVQQEIEKEAKDTSKNDKLNYLQMLLDVYAANLTEKEIGNLVTIYWDADKIKIEQKEDQLTPFLVVQFLNLQKSIVRKGLKKSYYKVQENLTNKVKGKILVGTHIKQNVFKNRMTKTFCEYQIFGENNTENKFLKKVFQFCISYVQNSPIFNPDTKVEINNIINYCRPAFELIKDDLQETQLHHLKYNPFFKEYKEAIKIGNYILKQFAYNISATSANEIETPPFWIDMPRLFELYFYQKLFKANNCGRETIKYQFSTYGNSLDFLISEKGFEMVIDTKYKLQYQTRAIHEDIRQVSGYARLNKVREELGFENEEDKVIDCLIVYPDLDAPQKENFTLDYIKENRKEISSYHKVYKLGISLPRI